MQIREREKFYFHKNSRVVCICFAVGVPLLFTMMAGDAHVTVFFRSLLRVWLFILIGFGGTYFPLYILSDDKIYFLTTKKLFKKFQLGGVPFEKMTRAVKLSFMMFLSLEPQGAIPILFLSKYDRLNMLEFLREKNPDIMEQKFS